MDSIGNDLRNLNEPFLSKMNRLNELGAVCQEKYANGFASMEGKSQLFLQLGTAFKEFSDLVRTHSPQNLPENATEKERVRYATTQMLVQTCLNEATLPESIFRRAVDMKDRIIAVENTKSWQNRSDITPDYAVLKSTKLNYLGAREGAQYKDYTAMMDALSVVTKNFGRTKQNSTQRLQLGESSRLAMEKGEAYLNSVIEHSAPNELSNNPSKQASATRLRVIGVLGILHTLNPEKAEQMLEKTKVLFGHKLNWDEVSTMAKQAYNRNPNFARQRRTCLKTRIRYMDNKRFQLSDQDKQYDPDQDDSRDQEFKTVLFQKRPEFLRKRLGTRSGAE